MPTNNDELKSRAEVMARLGRRSGLSKRQVLESFQKTGPIQENLPESEIEKIIEDAFYDPPKYYTGALLGIPPSEKNGQEKKT